MARSAIYTANINTQALLPGNTIGLGSVIRRFGCALRQNGNNITMREPGYYKVTASITAAPTAAGLVTATLFRSGVAVPGAVASATAAAAGNAVTLPITAMVRESCCNDDAALTLVLTGAASNVTNVALVVEKL